MPVSPSNISNNTRGLAPSRLHRRWDATLHGGVRFFGEDLYFVSEDDCWLLDDGRWARLAYRLRATAP